MGNSYMLSNRKHGAVWRTWESPLDYFLPTGLVQAASSLRLHLLNYQMGMRSQSSLILRGNDPYLNHLQASPCIYALPRGDVQVCMKVYRTMSCYIIVYLQYILYTLCFQYTSQNTTTTTTTEYSVLTSDTAS